MVSGLYPVREVKFNDGTCMDIPDRELKDYNYKVVRSGNVIEVYSYDQKVYYNYEAFPRSYVKEKTEEWHGKEERNLARSRREIRRLVWCNMNEYSKFLTLTYEENMQDLKKFYFDWKMFVQSMRRKGYDLKYLYVLEHQERGAIHAHVVLFNNEFIPWPVIKDSWKHGGIDIHKIRKVNNLGSYVCKYLTKDTLSEYNSKSYCTSRGLKRPIERKITLQEGANLNEELSCFGQSVFTAEYNITVNDIITNTVHYNQIKMD